MDKKRLANNAVKLKQAITEAAHKRRMQQQKEAAELGLSYAQYIAMDAECIERARKARNGKS